MLRRRWLLVARAACPVHSNVRGLQIIPLLAENAGGTASPLANTALPIMTRTTRAPRGLSVLLWAALPACVIAFSLSRVADAQDLGTLNPQPLPPLAHPESPKTSAKDLFVRQSTPAPLQARSIGFYSKGCLAGAVALPVNGRTWQVMRLSRNRNWGHPNLVAFLERLADQAPKTGWHGLLLGDMSQPRGGPLPAGHKVIRSVSMPISGSRRCPTASSPGKSGNT